MVKEVESAYPPIQLEALLDRWQTSLDLHAGYAALDDARYWHVQPWPKHERPARWIIQLARKRIIALKRIVQQRQAEGDRAFIEGIEIMSFLATMVGITQLDRFIPLATPETERRDVLASKAPPVAEEAATRTTTPARERGAGRTGEHRRAPANPASTGERRRAAETTREMPQLPNSKVFRMLAAQRAGVPLKTQPPAPAPAPAKARDPGRPATIKPAKKAPPTVSQDEHVVIADAVRLLGWGKQWHELADMIARLAERPSPSEIRRILRTYRDQINAVASKRKE
jgi:hypothetical protein